MRTQNDRIKRWPQIREHIVKKNLSGDLTVRPFYVLFLSRSEALLQGKLSGMFLNPGNPEIAKCLCDSISLYLGLWRVGN